MKLPRTTSSGVTRYWQIAAVVYLLAGIAAMWFFSPRVPYADQWNHYAHLLQRPFWTGVFSADNGHAEVLPNLLRLIELHLGSHETLQIASAMVLAALSVCVLLDLLLRDRELPAAARAASMFAVVFGVYWLGNTRALNQEHDAVHVYTVVLCLSLALRLALRPRASEDLPWRNLGAAVVLCLLASLSFGSGIGSFAALATLLVLQRARAAQVLVVFAAAIGSVLVYRALPGAVVQASGYDFSLAALTLTLRLLGSPFVYLFWPLLDPVAAAAVPLPLREIFVPIAAVWFAHFGDIHRSVFPQAAFGLAGLVLILWRSASIWRNGASRSAAIGIATAWFGLSVAALIAITRNGYFVEYPDQIYAPRYLPWLTLCWSGLLLAAVARIQLPRAALLIALGLPILALPSEIGMAVLGKHMRAVAEDIGLGAAVGIFPQSFTLGETDIDDLRVVLPLLREAHTAMFAWPEAQWLGQRAPASATPLISTDTQIVAAANRLDGASGSEVSVQIAASCNRERVLILAGDRVAGLLRPEPDGHWRGVVQGQPPAAELRFVALCN